MQTEEVSLVSPQCQRNVLNIYNNTTIRPVGAKLFHAVRQMNGMLRFATLRTHLATTSHFLTVSKRSWSSETTEIRQNRLYQSPFVWFPVYNTPRVRSLHSSNQTQQQQQKNTTNSHAQDTAALPLNVFLIGTRRFYFQ